MKKLPIGIQTFSELIEENYAYVDKTEQIYKLVTKGKYYFLSRPRRFGKSLLCSTLAEVLAGNKELFNDLAISKLDYAWKKHPIVSISLADLSCKNPDLLEKEIQKYLQQIAQEYNFSLEDTTTSGAMLRSLIKTLAKKERVALIIDEYDYPILQHVHNPEMANQMREALKDFYGVIKGLDKYLCLVFITGVSKFLKTSIFSGLNNLNDLTMRSESATLLGYTEQDIKFFFAEHITHGATHLNCSPDELIDQLRTWYNGYCFIGKTSPNQTINVYNPFSILNFLKEYTFSNYWFESGTPTFLINLLKAKDYPIQDFEHCEITEGEFGNFDVDNMPLPTLLFQTGYLTIKNYNPETKNYLLTYPNKETLDSLLERIFSSMTATSGANLNNTIAKLKTAFNQNKLENLKEILTHLYANVPYTIHIDQEKYYQTIFYIAFKLFSTDILVEQATNIGRLDAIIQTPTTCFIVEFKMRDSTQEAIEQIEDRKYYQPYLSTDKKMILVGIKFDIHSKNVKEVEWKEFTT